MVRHSLGASGGPGRRTRPSRYDPNKAASGGHGEDAPWSRPRCSYRAPRPRAALGRLAVREGTARTPQGMPSFHSVATDPEPTTSRTLVLKNSETGHKVKQLIVQRWS